MAAKQFYFAWVDPGTAFDPDVHARRDEIVTELHVEHEEGDFASLDLIIKNPKVGLLNPARKRWAWLSWFDGSVLWPLFYGRLVGVPGNMLKEAVELNFIARPLDYMATKIALANTLRVVGAFYDPIFQDTGDPDNVLEARTELWAIDRVTHAVTTSDFLVGEDGLEEFFTNEVPYDSVNQHTNQTPLRAVAVDASVSWSQKDSGDVDLGSRIVFTYTGASLVGGWPTPGASSGNGWEVKEAAAVDVFGVNDVQNAQFTFSWTNTEQKHAEGDTMSTNGNQSIPMLKGPSVKCELTHSSVFGIGHAEIATTTMHVALWQVNTSLVMHYEADRQRVEEVHFTLETDVQPVLAEADESDVLQLNISGRDIGVFEDLGDLKRQAFFTSDRGQSSLKYLIAVARAKLLLRTRAVEVDWSCRFERAIQLTLRKNGKLHDPRLPGGQALGKIIKYEFHAVASTGEFIGGLTIGCSVGNGGAVAEVVGDPVYAQAGYAQLGWQQYENKVVVLPGSDVGYTVPTVASDGDNMRFPLNYQEAVITDVWHNADNLEFQQAAIGAAFAEEIHAASPGGRPTIPEQHATASAGQVSVADALKAFGTWREITLKPVTGGPFTTHYFLETTVLKAPKQIDLESA